MAFNKKEITLMQTALKMYCETLNEELITLKSSTLKQSFIELKSEVSDLLAKITSKAKIKMLLTLKERILNWKNSGNSIDTLFEAEAHISKAWELIDDLCERIELATKTGN